MTDILALPMYAVSAGDNDRLWRAVQTLLLERGLRVSAWNGSDLLAHWQSPALLLSQTCGFPLVTQLANVQTVGCFHYTAPGCEGIHYRSFLVAREADAGKTLADFRSQRVACNSADSQSGYNVLRKHIEGQFFSETVFSGSHRHSLIALKQARADIAAIDCVTWALLQRHEPELLNGLSVVGETPLTPGLPLITAADASTIALLREALHALVSAPEYRNVCEAMLIDGFSEVSRKSYAVLLQSP